MPHPTFTSLFNRIAERHGAARIQQVCGYKTRSMIRALLDGRSMMSLQRAAILARWLCLRGDYSLRDWFDVTGPRPFTLTNGSIDDERLLLEDVGTDAGRAFGQNIAQLRRSRRRYKEAVDRVVAEIDQSIVRLERRKKQGVLSI